MRRPIAFTDAELKALVYASNVARNDLVLWEDDGTEDKRSRKAHERANEKLRAEARRRGWSFEGDR